VDKELELKFSTNYIRRKRKSDKKKGQREFNRYSPLTNSKHPLTTSKIHLPNMITNPNLFKNRIRREELRKRSKHQEMKAEKCGNSSNKRRNKNLGRRNLYIRSNFVLISLSIQKIKAL